MGSGHNLVVSRGVNRMAISSTLDARTLMQAFWPIAQAADSGTFGIASVFDIVRARLTKDVLSEWQEAIWIRLVEAQQRNSGARRCSWGLYG